MWTIVRQPWPKLRTRGVKCDDAETIPGMVSYANVYDPEGNRFQIAQSLASASITLRDRSHWEEHSSTCASRSFQTFTVMALRWMRRWPICQQNPVDQIVCLGDAVQGGPQPAQVVARLREIACPVVMGNADAWLLSGQETGNEQIPAERLRKMHAIRDWSLSQLSADDRAFIGQFKPTVTIDSEIRPAAALFSRLAGIVRRHSAPHYP